MTNLENRKAITTPRTSSHKLRSILGKMYDKITDITLCKYCCNGEIRNQINFFSEFRNYGALRKDTLRRIKELEEMNLEK